MLRVAAYCRVSTDKEDQLNSLENQKVYFEEYIKRNPEWQFITIYADEGLSGTSTTKRKQFNLMIEDAKAHKFDLIVTKEVSRFARNTVDTLTYTQMLKTLGIGVYFLNDNINTLDTDGELRLTIMAGIAQEESRKTSERVKWGQKRSMKNGVVFGNVVLGYTIDKGKLYINHNEAETVKLIFHKYLNERKGLTAIARDMEKMGKLTGHGKPRWDATAIKRILLNEKYCGDLKQGKFYTPDYLTHKPKKNVGENEFIEVSETHEAIIDRETFHAAQLELSRRKTIEQNGTRYTNRYPFSGRLVCGICGTGFVSRPRKANDGSHMIQRWQCGRYFKYGAKQNDERGCENKMIRNEVLEYVFNFALNDAIEYKETIIGECVSLLTNILDDEQVYSERADVINEIRRIANRVDRLIELRLDGEITKEELQKKREPLDIQMNVLNEKLVQIEKNTILIEERDILLDEIKSHVSNIVHTEVYSESIVKEVLEKIIVYGKNKFDVYFHGIKGKHAIIDGNNSGCKSSQLQE